MRNIASRAHSLYIGPKPKIKKNGGIRLVFDTKAPLKSLLKKINTVFLKQVTYPTYLTGSLPGRNFVSNVAIHNHSIHAITEDISEFFDNITAEHVYGIWSQFFGFAHEVADILTTLTTREGRVFQGTPTSSYLANLAFWDKEPTLVARMTMRGIRYSRYVDDITVSCNSEMYDESKRWAISQVYGMIGSSGFKPKRAKHGSLSARTPITIMGLNANQHPSITKQERASTRALVFQLERRYATGENGLEFKRALNHASGKVGRLSQLHVREGTALRERLSGIRKNLDGVPRVIEPRLIPVESSIGSTALPLLR